MAWREGAALVGVVLASLLPTLLGLPVMLGVFAAALLLGWWAWTRAPGRPAPRCRPPCPAPPCGIPGGKRRFAA